MPAPREKVSMPRFAANLSMMFNEVPFLDRFAAARAAGFEAVEFLFPYEHPAAEIRARLDACGLALALFNAPPGDWAAGERGLAALPGREAEFRAGVLRALDYADVLGGRLLHCMAGIAAIGTPTSVAATAYKTNLEWASEQARKRGVRLAIEPINRRDMPGYFLETLRQGAELVAALGPDRVGLQFDVYHCQITESRVIGHLRRLMPIVAHVQIADAPGRHEPGTGAIAWAEIFGALDSLGYDGWVGCEYRPLNDTISGLGWRDRIV
jgi:hydroxypyruvate isomerase